MAIRTVKLCGELVSDATVTITWDGVEKLNGAPLNNTKNADDESIIAEWTFDDLDSAATQDHALSIAVNSGMITADTLWFNTAGVNNAAEALGHLNISEASDIAGVGFWRPLNSHPYGDGDNDTALAERSNILVNGAVPTTTTAVTITGTAAAPTWMGWFFTLSAGEELTCTARAPVQWAAA